MASETTTDTDPDPEAMPETSAAPDTVNAEERAAEKKSDDSAAAKTDEATTDTVDVDAAETTKAEAAAVATGAAPVASSTSGTGSAGGALVGAGGLVSAGLGLASMTGTSLGEMLRAREELLGQIAAVTGGPGGDQIETLYAGPWHTAALVNGVFALLAVLIGAVLFFGPARKPGALIWGRALALGGLVLGVIGLVVSGGMYLDLFAAAPQMPAMPGMPG